MCQQQSENGAFRSLLHWEDASYEDWNCFTTGLVLRHARGELDSAVRERAFDFLLQCRRPGGAFGFWPIDKQPSVIRETLPPDCDDSSIAAIELALGGRWGRSEIRQLVFETIVKNRLPCFDEPAPPWLRPGVFLTWLGPDSRNRTVDCCANANVIALLAFGELTHVPGYAEACQMIEAGIRWAGDDPVRARSLTPYYPDPGELRYAIDHAVKCGSQALEESHRLLRHTTWARLRPRANVPICSNAYGGAFWTSPVLQSARQNNSYSTTRWRKRLRSAEPCRGGSA